MTEREWPIIYKPEMVRPIFSRDKTCTRRIIAFEHPDAARFVGFRGTDRLGRLVARFMHAIPDDPVPIDVPCPYGSVGATLWVRETWAPHPIDEGEYVYRADIPADQVADERWVLRVFKCGKLRWRPSIHMPKKACRLRLRVLGLRVERLCDITNEQARAEGIPKDGLTAMFADAYRDRFVLLWNTINRHKAPFDTNPWVWVVDFRMIGPAEALRAG